jgi:hypothetical protein
MYDSVISRAVKMQNAAVQVDVKITKRQSSMDERSKALTTSSSIKDIDSLPHLIPQRTNVLTGASTSYYVNKPAIWNTEYLKLVNY